MHIKFDAFGGEEARKMSTTVYCNWITKLLRGENIQEIILIRCDTIRLGKASECKDNFAGGYRFYKQSAGGSDDDDVVGDEMSKMKNFIFKF